MRSRQLRFDDQVARLWTSKSPSDIAEVAGCSLATVYSAARRTGVQTVERTKGHRWTPEEDEALHRIFPLMRPRELEKHFGLSFEQIRTRAKRLGLRSRQALALAGIQHDFFARSTPDAAYFAGLLAADGWITARHPEISLALKESDRDMVDRFAASVGASREVRVYRGQARAVVCSDKLVADLAERWGVRPGKTHDLQPPTIDDRQLQLAYAAGHLDGDGFISGTPRSRAGALVRCGAIGTEDVIRWIAAVLDARLAAAGRAPVRVRQVGIEKYSFPMFEWRTSDNNAVVVLDAMRAVIGGRLGISRKWATFERYRAVLAARQTEGAA
jgi:hypothetical protein